MPRAQQIHMQPHGARYAGRQLPEERVPRVDISSLAVLRPQQSALLRVLAGIMAAQQWLEMLVPFVHEIESAFLHPAVEVASRDFIRIVKYSILPRQNFHRSLLHRNPRPA